MQKKGVIKMAITYDLKVKVKTAEGNTATRTLISGATSIDATESNVKRLINKYQVISTDRIDTSTGYAQVTVVQTNSTSYANAVTVTGGGVDYMDSEDTLQIRMSQGEDVKTVSYSNTSTWDTVQGTEAENQWKNDVRNFASAIYNMSSLRPLTAKLISKIDRGSFSADEDE